MQSETSVDLISQETKSDEEGTEKVAVESEAEEKASADNVVMDTGADKDCNMYSYVERDEYTCEKFKVEIGNLPRHVSYVELKKLLTDKMQLQPHKIKLIGKPRAEKFAFVAFKSEEQREAAIEKCNDYEFKGRILHAKKANPAPDPLVKKRRQERDNRNGDSKKQAVNVNTESVNLEELINDQVAPLWKMDYEEQLITKFKAYEEFLLELYKDIGKIDRDFGKKCPLLFSWWKSAKNEFNSCCRLEEIKRSPVISGYRNKCELNIGVNKAVGFRLGLYKDGNTTVVTPPDNCPILSHKMREIIITFEKYLKNISTQPAFNNENNTGFWRQLTVRTSSSECMLIVAINPGETSNEAVHEEMQQLKKFLQDNCTFDITSIYLHSYRKRETVVGNQSQTELIAGNEFISETMNDNSNSEAVRTFNFKISPFAFFQVNTAAAEVCYRVIADLARLTPNTILLDVCCGTGTIGLYLASKVKHVIGIELSEDAVKDCYKNATDNGIENIEFINGKAEDVIGLAISRARSMYNEDELIDLVCVIDPPRAGLNNSIVKLIRSRTAINRFVYVSCEPRIAKKNLIDLCRPPSKQYQELPFVPTAAVPVDMFPHTKHCELVLLYERLSEELLYNIQNNANV